MRSGWSRLGGQLVCLVVLAFGVGMLPAPVASAATPTATRLSGFVTTRASVRVGGALWSTVTVTPRAVRTLSVQYRRAGTTTFRTASTGRTSASGVLTVALKPIAAGTWQFRVAVAATPKARAAVSASRTIVASGSASRTTISGYLSSPATVGVGLTVVDDVVVLPGGSRVVTIEAIRPGSRVFVGQSAGISSTRGAFRAIYRPTIAGVWRYRLVARTTATALAATSPTRTITALAPVTLLRKTAVTSTSISLAWTNPVATTFSGATIRRAVGAIAPASATAGTVVATLTKPASTVTNSALAAGTTYSYSVFARYGTSSYSAAAKLTVTTAPGPVTGLAATKTQTSITLTWTNPTTANFAGVTIRRANGGIAPASPTAGTAVATLAKPLRAFTNTGLIPGATYSYAVFARDGIPYYSIASKLSVTTPDMTPPRPVTGLTATLITAPAVTLNWTNPTDTDFAGVVVRRSLPGEPAPASPTDGVAVVCPPKPAHTCISAGLTGGTQYWYAVFARDAVPNYAAAATLPVTTPAAVTTPPTADLAVKRDFDNVADTRLTVGGSATFDASNSSPVNPATLVSALLDYGDGSPLVMLDAAGSWQARHSYSSAGQHTAKLIMTDSAGAASAPVEVTIDVYGLPTATITPGAAQVDLPVTFTLGTSTPPGTSITSYDLRAGSQNFDADGLPPATKDITFTTPGWYTVEFGVVNDVGGSSATAVYEFYVSGAATTAALTAEKNGSAVTKLTVGQAATFGARDSFAGPAGRTIKSVSLDYGDGTVRSFTGTDQAAWFANHSYATAGDKTVTLTVTDTADAADTDFVTITVYALPTANVTASAPALTGRPVTFTLTADTPAGTTLTSWSVSTVDQGAGAPPATVQHTFPSAGLYPVTFTVANDVYGVAVKAITVTVVDPDITPPGRVTEAQVSGRPTSNSLSITWVNPHDADFAGVMIRRKLGPVAPTSPTDGTLVAELAAPETTFTDPDSPSSLVYSYAIFAYDEVPNYSPGVTVIALTE